MKLVSKYGKLWPRNDDSFKALAAHGKGEDLRGLYVLYDGSMPVYVGKGAIMTRLAGHRKSKARRDFWDYFSWFEVRDAGLQHDVECLLLKILPYYLRLLNKQQAHFPGVRGIKLKSKSPEVVTKPKFVKIVRRRSKMKR